LTRSTFKRRLTFHYKISNNIQTKNSEAFYLREWVVEEVAEHFDFGGEAVVEQVVD
jgi:hypothetical protein